MWINAKRNESMVTFHVGAIGDLMARDLMISDISEVAAYQRNVHVANQQSQHVPAHTVAHVDAVLHEADKH